MRTKNLDKKFGFATRAVHGGNEIDKETLTRPYEQAWRPLEFD